MARELRIWRVKWKEEVVVGEGRLGRGRDVFALDSDKDSEAYE